ncbi:HPr-rel-A system PqqD family peptide chaperone [Sphingomonas sp. SRS2]|uniref:HPr-rel-A system PqqD family peptide chaperone n=1 Tax=Sphingomonas sp. SRS2 TaxID=133190 RepID=UPI0006184F26|nr:HPr-rel-A system PqqD family peptide chaperone [Sphingomonas sp. SRS2]KKC27361.1 hypothetical protein WP12_03645 [Sphingomonas sp. SRS2]
MSSQIYRTDFPNQCRTHAIDGMTLIFHRPSGMTHFLDSPVPEMLALLGETPMSAAELSVSLCTRLEMPHDAEALAVVEARLAELIATGLVQAG